MKDLSVPESTIVGSPLTPPTVTFREALSFWLKLGFISFGGPAGQISIMHQELVENRRWISERRFLHALNYCMILPGPEAQQLATYIGWLMHRTYGGIVAGTWRWCMNRRVDSVHHPELDCPMAEWATFSV